MHWDVRRFAEIDSTNRWLVARAEADAPAGLVAVAGHQTAGRGRLDRAWLAPRGTSLLASVLFRPDDLPPARRHLVTAAVALSAADACENVAGLRPALKWPNDLVVGDRKLGGLLAEAGDGWLVVGFGLNVDWKAADLSALGPTATSLNQEGDREPDGDSLLGVVLDRLGHWYGRWDDVARAYRRACATIGRAVRVELAGETFTGTAADVSDEGHLLVDVGMCLRTVSAGDVVHLRPV